MDDTDPCRAARKDWCVGIREGGRGGCGHGYGLCCAPRPEQEVNVHGKAGRLEADGAFGADHDVWGRRRGREEALFDRWGRGRIEVERQGRRREGEGRRKGRRKGRRERRVGYEPGGKEIADAAAKRQDDFRC